MSEAPMQEPVEEVKDSSKSSLPKFGCLLMLLGLGLPGIVSLVARGLGDGSGRLTNAQRILLISTDLFRLLVFVGLTMLIIGLLRNRRSRKKTK